MKAKTILFILSALVAIGTSFVPSGGAGAAELAVKRVRLRVQISDSPIGNAAGGFMGVTLLPRRPGQTGQIEQIDGTLEFALRDGRGMSVPVVVRTQGLLVGLGVGGALGRRLKLRLNGFRGHTLRDLMTNYRGVHATAVLSAGTTFYYLRGDEDLILSGWNPRFGILAELMFNEGIFLTPAAGVSDELLDTTLI